VRSEEDAHRPVEVEAGLQVDEPQRVRTVGIADRELLSGDAVRAERQLIEDVPPGARRAPGSREGAGPLDLRHEIGEGALAVGHGRRRRAAIAGGARSAAAQASRLAAPTQRLRRPCPAARPSPGSEAFLERQHVRLAVAAAPMARANACAPESVVIIGTR